MNKPIDEIKVSDLTDYQRSHMAWRLDSETCCGLLNACRIARMEMFPEKSVKWIFEWTEDCTPQEAEDHVRKCIEFANPFPDPDSEGEKE